MRVIRVALDVPVPHLFDYTCEAAEESDVGCRTIVPFSNRKLVGLVMEVADASSLPAEKLRNAHAILKDAPPLPKEWLELAKFCSSYYQKPIGEVAVGVLPPRLRQTTALSQRRKKRAAAETALQDTPAAPKVHVLNPEQRAAFEQARASFGEFQVFHLFGITGSGKTEVYLHLIAEALARGMQALVLVPEIALTPALESKFRSRFPGAFLAVQHSAMPHGERAHGWVDAQTGKADIVLGTRLAVFVPLPRLGLIVVDEEQDASFKQQEGLRYSARDVAVFRARQSSAPVLLVSATPSLETLHRALSGRYRLLKLPRRAHAQARLPDVRLIDCRGASFKDGVSDGLAHALESRLSRGEQSIVFLNRRGYAPVLSCNHCGWIAGCPRCSAYLVVHLRDKLLRCHHCGREERIPRACPECGNLELVPFGRGTQRLEASLQERFPAARILRVDSDAAGGHASRLIDSAHAGEADIMVGTQIIAKGHDFARVTLVGVVNADAGLFAADYRAPERLFAQLQQVGGRAGRAELPGEVLVQTRYPDHPLYLALVRHDYEAYARQLLDERKQAGFPPFVHEAALRAEAAEMEDALGFLALALRLVPEREGVTLYDPAPASLPRLASVERAQVIAQSASRPALQRLLASWGALLHEQRATRVRWHFDVDPVEF